MKVIFEKGDKVIYHPEEKIYDFGCYTNEAKTICKLYEEGSTLEHQSFKADVDCIGIPHGLIRNKIDKVDVYVNGKHIGSQG